MIEKSSKCPILILIPVYNCVDYLAGCLDSILAQTFKQYKVVIYDDFSLDGSQSIIRDYVGKHEGVFYGIENRGDKQWNGGARNRLLEYCEANDIKADYVLFMDADDKFVDETVLQKVFDATVQNWYPDVLRLSYMKKNPGNKYKKKIIKDRSPADMAVNSKVAPWTKLVKQELYVPFPENTLFEDVAQHLAQADIVETVASVDFPVIEWNRCNLNSVSTGMSLKRKSSAFRFIADLMDLELEKPYTRSRRDFKVKDAAKNLGINYDWIDWRKVCC